MRLWKYAKQIGICKDIRNSYSKTDPDATFMRVKRDGIGNDRLLPHIILPIGICNEYIVVSDAKQYTSYMDFFLPLTDKADTRNIRLPMRDTAENQQETHRQRDPAARSSGIAPTEGPEGEGENR